VLGKRGERAGNRCRDIVGYGDRLEHPPKVRAERADGFEVVRLQARQSIESIVHRRHIRHDSLEGVRRHAEAIRHTDALDPRKFRQVCRLATNERDMRLVDLVEPQHVAVQTLTSFTEGAPTA
jgi:hypothetical protein